MKNTEVCRLLGIQYPILQGGMLWIATAELAAAVSNAGALGVISPYAGMDNMGDSVKNLENQIKKTRQRTSFPFAINIPLDLKDSGILIDLAIHQGVKIIITAAGSPEMYSELIKGMGVKVLHVVSSVKQARLAEASGVDVIICEGVEAAAHNGFDELPLFSLIPQIVDEVSLPVIAAGGIVDSRGLVASLALGAAGVQLGTRFVVVEENIAHQNYKQAILEAGDNDTAVTARKLLPTRSLKSSFSKQLLELEAHGATAGEISRFIGYRRARKGQIDGDLEAGELYCGTSAGLLKEILPADQVIKNLVSEYQIIINKLL